MNLKKIIPSFVLNKVEGRLNLQKIIANTGWLFFDRIFRMGVGLFVSVWVTRYLGPEQFGMLSYAQAMVAIFGAIATLELDAFIVRHLVREPSKYNEYLGTAFILKFLGGLCLTLFTVLLIMYIKPNQLQIQLLVGIIAVGTLFQSFDVIDFWFQSKIQSKYTVIAKNIGFTVISIAKIILILLKASLVWFAVAGVVEIIIGSLLLLIFYNRQCHSREKWKFRLDLAKMLLKESWPLILSGMAIMIYMRIDQIMIGQMVGNGAVGIYTSALRISEVWYFIPTIIVTSVAPTIVTAKKENELLYKERIQQLFIVMVIIGYLISIPMTFLSDFLVVLLYGDDFIESGKVLAIHIWASIFVFLGVVRSQWLINEGLTKFSFYTTLIGAVINVGLNYILIPIYNEVGAAIATLFSYSVAAVFSCLWMKKTKEIGIIMLRTLLLMNVPALFRKNKK